MTELFRLFIAVILLTTTLASYFLVMSALFPTRVTKTQALIQQAMGRSFGLGMVNFLFFGAIALAMLSFAENMGAFVKGIITIPALIILAFLSILLSIGLTSMVKELGEKIFPDLISWKQILWGSVILSFACALPFVGWFLLLPFVAFVGIGGTILAFFQKS